MPETEKVIPKKDPEPAPSLMKLRGFIRGVRSVSWDLARVFGPLGGFIVGAFNPKGRRTFGRGMLRVGIELKRRWEQAESEAMLFARDLIILEVTKWVVIVIFGIIVHNIAYYVIQPWLRRPDAGTVNSIILLWVLLIAVPMFFVWLAAKLYEKSFVAKFMPSVGMAGGLGNLLTSSYSFEGAEEFLESVGQNLKRSGNVFLYGIWVLMTKVQNEGSWFTGTCWLLIFAPFFFLWPHPGFLVLPAMGICYLWEVNTSYGNNQTADGHRVVSKEKFEALADDPATGKKTLVEGQKYLLPGFQKFGLKFMGAFIVLMVLISYINLFATIHRVNETVAAESAVSATVKHDGSGGWLSWLTHPTPDQQEVWRKIFNWTNMQRWATQDSGGRQFVLFWLLPVGIAVLVIASLFGGRWWKSPGFMCFLATIFGWVYIGWPLWLWGPAMFVAWLVINRRNQPAAASAH